ncbi:MAG TPA: hypothetical protein VFV05_01650 [Methylomirabilota bacterium]|nr:hypothetical protein [Methylomirabilota bacterium]
MPHLRFTLILALAAVMHLGGVTLPEGTEAFEEIEEAAHGRRRLARLARQADPPSATAGPATTAAMRPRPAYHPARARAAVTTPARKAPTPPPDPASATDDH